ncbi:1,2-phenylacetyl-CoA epoxidase subunit PaaD [Marinicella sediminis]|uniref:1,2-phenylacetyl-CoA epoxidase subunit PaaD n=1 Tax=Marinicella sediminis TaxID=1792834 RepID=A0ABV7JBU9_9GAMM|nr:1,2-phenylacetyl-CoA epoxidase subunit PaaD [Marinicella sediminis]
MSGLTARQVLAWLQAVKDPEIPVISIQDLGVLQAVEITNEQIVVKIIPTYSGCPAMYVIQDEIRQTLAEHGQHEVDIQLLNTPAWNTDMITARGRAAMKLYGIAPPISASDQVIQCPQCGSEKTTCISQFGSTACKALYRCESCLEPFDYFKCHA